MGHEQIEPEVLSEEETAEINEGIDQEIETFIARLLGPDLIAWHRRMERENEDE